MANRLKKLMQPILKQKCSEAFQEGFRKGVEEGWRKKKLAYENEISFLKGILQKLEADCRHGAQGMWNGED